MTETSFEEVMNDVLRLLIYGPFARFKLKVDDDKLRPVSTAPFEEED